MGEAQATLQQWLERLRSEGAARLDPVRFHYLEALARRMAGQPEPVRRLLLEKLQAGLAACAQRLDPARQAAVDAVRPRQSGQPVPAGCAPLARLNQSLRDAAAAGRPPPAPGEPQERDELASVRRFRRAWTRSRTLEQVDRAAARKPANAGPLNSHVLVLQSLALMGELSPDYLRRFLLQVESLQWLDQARLKYPPQAGPAPAARPARRSRQKK